MIDSLPPGMVFEHAGGLAFGYVAPLCLLEVGGSNGRESSSIVRVTRASVTLTTAGKLIEFRAPVDDPSMGHCPRLGSK